MKDVAIVESGKEFKFSGTGKLETELQNGGSCYWVPKEERETGHIFASENRDYTADEISKYGISSVDVNIFFTGITDDGEPWSVTIDPDTELPIIDIGDIEITIDDIGDIDIHIPGGDPDDWPGWDDLDPDLKEDFDDWVNDGNDPDDWPGWDDLDPGIKDDFDDWTSDIDTSIDDSMLDDMGIDPDADIDLSVDDLGNIDISDGDISVNLDPITGEWETSDCPASIQILQMPTKDTYTEGEVFNLDGIVVQALDKEGNPWTSGGYADGIIPTKELLLPETEAVYDKSNDLAGMLDGSFLYRRSDGKIESGSIFPHRDDDDNKWSGSTGGGSATVRYDEGWPIIQMSYGGITGREFPVYYYNIAFKTVFGSDGSSSFVQYQPGGPGGNFISLDAEGTAEILNDAYMFKDNESGQIEELSWVSPCLVNLGAKISFVVNKKPDNEGSHHSGKF